MILFLQIAEETEFYILFINLTNKITKQNVIICRIISLDPAGIKVIGLSTILNLINLKGARVRIYLENTDGKMYDTNK